jgi:predicted aspartyl protease
MLSELQQEVKSLKDERRYKTSACKQKDLSKTKCFSCGILGHVAKYCRKSNASGTKSFVRTKQHSTTKINEDHRSGSIYVSMLANEAVMFIKSKVNGLNANMLVDTGATVTLVSIKLFESKASPVMTEMKREILTASGSKLTVLGKTIIDIDINGYVCSNVAIVADINVDGILGLDFQRSQNCTINVAKGSILIHGHKVSLQFEGQIGCYKVATAKTIKMQSIRKYIVERKVKEAGFLEKEQCPVYKKQFEEKYRLSFTQCSKDFKKAAYLRRHMQKSHSYKITCLEQVVESSTQERHEDMKETDSKKTHISDSGDLMKMIGSIAGDAVLSSDSDMEDGEAKQSVRDEQDPEEVCKNLQKEIVFYANSKEYTKNPEDNISDGEHLHGSGEIEQQSFADRKYG